MRSWSMFTTWTVYISCHLFRIFDWFFATVLQTALKLRKVNILSLFYLLMLRCFLKDQFDICIFFFFFEFSFLVLVFSTYWLQYFSNFCCSHECSDKRWLVEPPPEGYIFLVWPLPVQGGRATSGFLTGILFILWW